MIKMLLVGLIIFFTGCTVRILTFGNESSVTDKTYSIGYNNEGDRDGKE